jgi:hypothetical protein
MGLQRTDYLGRAKAPDGKREVQYPSPNVSNLVVVESVPISPDSYKALPYGSPHESYDTTGLVLVRQRQIKATDNQIWVTRVYASRNINEDWYDYTLRYAGDVIANPIFIRSYHKLRNEFVPVARGTPFKGVYRMIVTANGANYTSPPTVVFTGANTTPASANAIMSPPDDSGNMTVIGLELTDEGDGYTSAPTIVFSGGGGSGATATAYIQPAAAILIKEELVEIENESPDLASLFVKVTRVYETLPGPLFISSEYDDDKIYGERNRGAVKKTIQAIFAVGNEVASFDRPSSGQARKTWYEPRGESAIVLNKTIETWTEIQIHDKAMTEEFGGGILGVDKTRAAVGAQTPDEGYLVVESDLATISPDEQIKTSKQLTEPVGSQLLLSAGGSGYTSPPTVGFTGGVGSGAVATARVGKGVASIAVSAGGSGYVLPPIVVIDGDGYGARAAAVLTAGVVTSITILDDGNDYTSTPTITFEPVHGGSGAVGVATLESTGEVTQLVLTNPGAYTVAPTVTFSGGGGSGAAATYALPSLEWPERIGCNTDEKYGIVVGISKKVVPATTRYPGVATALSTPQCGIGPFVDLDPHSRYRSIQVVSKVDLHTLPKLEIYPISHPLHIPPTLLAVEAVWSDVESKLVEALKTSAHVSVSSGSGGGIIVRRSSGYHGLAIGQATRLWFCGPPPIGELPVALKIIPSSGSVVLTQTHSNTHYAQFDDGGVSFGDEFHLQIHSVDVNDHLVGSFDIVNATHTSPPQSALAISGGGSVASVSAFGTPAYMTVSIPVSTPSALFSGQFILADVIVERWRLGLWTVELIYVTIP